MTEIEDPYLWLEKLDDPQVLDFVKKENERTRAFLGDLPNKLYPRIAEYYMKPYLIMANITKKGIFTLIREEKSRRIYLLNERGERQLIVDSADLGKDAVLKFFYTSDDGKYLAFSYSIGGSDVGIIKIIDTDSLEIVDELQGTIYEIQWLDDNKYYYVRFYRTEKTPDGVPGPTSRIILRENKEDSMAFGEGVKTSYFVDLAVSTDRKTALPIISYGWTRSTIYGGPIEKPEQWSKVYEGSDFPVVPIDAINDEYYIISYEGQGFGKILEIDKSGNKKIIVDEYNYPLQNAVSISNKILAHYLVDASSKLKLFSLNGALIKEISFDYPGTVRSLVSDGKLALFKYETFWIPYRLYRFNSENLEIVDANEIKENFSVEEKFVTSKDGTKVHVFIIKKPNAEIKKVLLYGYGGFGISVTPSYSSTVIPFINDGGVYVIANIRGGSEYGEMWHKAGMLDKKQNVFDDFIAVAEYFKNIGAKVVPMGGSNGGLLVGATLTQRPDLLDGAIIGYPVLDMLRFHKLYIGKAWVPEYGNPENPEHRKFLIKYSPYHNVDPKRQYPPTFIFTGLYDDRVHPSHAFKFAMKLRETKSPVYLRIETVSGHAGATPETKIKEYADIMSFLYKVTKMEG